MKNILLALVCVALMNSCTKSDSSDGNAVDLGYDYFPLESGLEWVYRVDSFAYNNNSGSTKIDTFQFYYKENMGESFIDDAGQAAFKIYRYFADSLTGNWEPANNWSANSNSSRAEKVVENVRLVKLIFPVKLNNTWNANMFNNTVPLDCSIDELNQSIQLNGVMYNQTLLVDQQKKINAIEEIVKYERYAIGVGLIYALSDSINTQSNGARGYRYRFTLISHH